MLPYLSQEHQQQVASAADRAKQITMNELNAIIGVSIMPIVLRCLPGYRILESLLDSRRLRARAIAKRPIEFRLDSRAHVSNNFSGCCGRECRPVDATIAA